MFSQFLTDTMCVSRGKMQTIKREQVQKYQRIYDNIPCYLYFAKNNLGYLAGSDVAKLTP